MLIGIPIATLIGFVIDKPLYKQNLDEWNIKNKTKEIHGNVDSMKIDERESHILTINGKEIKLADYVSNYKTEDVYNQIEVNNTITIYKSDRIVCNGKEIYDGETKPNHLWHFIGICVCAYLITLLICFLLLIPTILIEDKFQERKERKYCKFCNKKKPEKACFCPNCGREVE